MVGASKILTVSYGTFSCTLEGFDDPFNTMRAIAEYFRDLAAEDRFFGATPPTPDADMLHRIAEREIQRRVEARVSDHGIVLRARDEAGAAPAAPLTEAPRAPAAEPAPLAATAATSAAALATAATAPVVGRAAEPVAAPETEFEDLVEEHAGPAETSIPAPATGTAAAIPVEPRAEAAVDDMSDVAAKLSRIRAVIAAAQAAKAAPAPAADEAIFTEAAKAETRPAAAFEEEPAVEADFDIAAAVDDDFGFDLELDEVAPARSAGRPQPAAEVVEPLFEDEETALDVTVGSTREAPSAAPEAVAAVEAIEDLTGEETAAVEGPEVGSEGEVAKETPAEPEAVEAELEDEDYAALAIATLTGGEEAPGDVGETVGGTAGDAELDALDLAGWRVDADETIDAAIDEEEDLAAADSAGVAKAPAAEESETSGRRPGFFERARARVINIRRGIEPVSETPAEAMAGEPGDDVLHAEPAPDAGPEAHEALAGAAAAGIGGDVADDLAKEAREEAEHAAIFAALNAEDAAEATFEDEADGEDAEVEAGSLADAAAGPDEDEAAESDDAILAAITAIRSDAQPEAEADDALARDLAALARDVRRDVHEGRSILEDHAGDGEASVERLMEEAKSKLEGDESRRRFSAIAHLKAAVAATVADRKLKSQALPADEATAPVEDIDRYREDLSKAVRPRRPVAEGAPATRRPALNDRPAPLVLVSEQRVDLPAEAIKPAAVIRPRRVGAAALSLTDVEEDADEEAPLSPEEAKSFAEFADRLGATNLAELLEAAAAYTATVEGMPHFSRPHLLRKVANIADEEEFSREDGLRSFGMLLRQGKIQKISRGQFMITEASRFMSEARRAAH